MADTETRPADTAAPAPVVPLSSGTGLPWAAWFAVTCILALSTTNLVVLAAVLGAALGAARIVGGPRRSLATTSIGIALVLAAAWVLLGMTIHRDGLGGSVVWVLPAWSPETGGSFGGPVTAAELHLALVRGTRAAALIGMLALLAQAVPATGWLRLNDLLWGRAAPAVGPLVCLGEAHARQSQELASARAAGLEPVARGDRTAGLAAHARRLAEEWVQIAARPRPRWRAVLGLLGVAGLVVVWARTVIGDPIVGGVELTDIELTVLLAVALVALGSVLHPHDLPRPTRADLAPAIAAAFTLVAWLGRTATGDDGRLDAPLGALPEVPVVTVAAIVLLPLLLLGTGSRR